MLNIAGFGTTIWMVAKTTFPVGFLINNLADDADPVDFSEIEIGEQVKGVNGDTANFSKPVLIPVNVAVLPTSASDNILNLLLQANVVNKNKAVNNDDITAVVTYANGRVTTLTDGIITGGVPSPGVSNAGRQKTMTYKFSFGSYERV